VTHPPWVKHPSVETFARQAPDWRALTSRPLATPAGVDAAGAIVRPARPVARLAEAFHALCDHGYNAFILPRVRELHPAMLQPASADHAFAAKLHFLTVMYARGLYSLAFVSPRVTRALGPLLWLSNRVPLPRAVLEAAVRMALWLAWRVAPKRLHQRLLVACGVITLVDELMDRAQVDGHVADVSNAINAALAGENGHAAQGKQAIVNGLLRDRLKMEANREAFVSGMRGIVATWTQEESQLARKEARRDDPSFRMGALLAVTRTLMRAVGPLVGLNVAQAEGPQEQWTPFQHFIFDNAVLVQLVDDWMDRERDAAMARPNFFAEGSMSLEDLRARWRRAEQGLDDLMDRCNMHNPTLREVFHDLHRDYFHTGLAGMDLGDAA
jgi:hypothetical protein